MATYLYTSFVSEWGDDDDDDEEEVNDEEEEEDDDKDEEEEEEVPKKTPKGQKKVAALKIRLPGIKMPTPSSSGKKKSTPRSARVRIIVFVLYNFFSILCNSLYWQIRTITLLSSPSRAVKLRAKMIIAVVVVAHRGPRLKGSTERL